jgi:hypothetical protein
MIANDYQRLPHNTRRFPPLGIWAYPSPVGSLDLTPLPGTQGWCKHMAARPVGAVPPLQWVARGRGGYWPRPAGTGWALLHYGTQMGGGRALCLSSLPRVKQPPSTRSYRRHYAPRSACNSASGVRVDVKPQDCADSGARCTTIWDV